MSLGGSIYFKYYGYGILSNYLPRRFYCRTCEGKLILTLTFAGQIGIMILLVPAESYSLAIMFGIARGIVGGFEQ